MAEILAVKNIFDLQTTESSKTWSIAQSKQFFMITSE